MSDFVARYIDEDGTVRRLRGPGDLAQRHGGTLLLQGTPEHQYQAGSWSDAVSTYVLRRRGEVRWDLREASHASTMAS